MARRQPDSKKQKQTNIIRTCIRVYTAQRVQRSSFQLKLSHITCCQIFCCKTFTVIVAYIQLTSTLLFSFYSFVEFASVHATSLRYQIQRYQLTFLVYVYVSRQTVCTAHYTFHCHTIVLCMLLNRNIIEIQISYTFLTN